MKNSKICFLDDDRKRLNLKESVLSLGNTYMGMRGVEEENPKGSKPGVYIAGLFDRSESLVSEIVNFPNLLSVYLVIDGEKVSIDSCKLLEYYRELDMEKGLVNRKVLFETKGGKKVRIESSRFLSFSDANCGAILYRVIPSNFNGSIQVISEYDASIINRRGAYCYEEGIRHYNILSLNDQYEENFYARLRVRDSGVEVFNASCILCEPCAKSYDRKRKYFGDKVEETIQISVKENTPVTIYKYFVIGDTRVYPVNRLKDICISKLERMKSLGFQEELQRSAAILDSKWRMSNVEIDGDDESDRTLRFNLYNLLVLGSETCSEYSIGAKGLSTERYGGHYFWDTEVYILPFFLNTNPAIAKNLLMFRNKTLEKAKMRAIDHGYEGCLWSWQSDANGEEGIRQTVRENGVIERRDILDQYHIVSDVAFACFRYLEATRDEYFFGTVLVPLVIEGMRFWKSFILKTNDMNAEKFEIRNVMGPDEYHTRVSNNYYTNYITKQVFKEFFDYFEHADEKQKYDVITRNNLKKEELDQLKSLGEKICLPEVIDHVIEQFEGYFNLKDFVVSRYNEKGLPLYPDETVGAGMPHTEKQDALQQHAKSTQLIKQADAVLTLCQRPSDFSDEVKTKTLEYYRKRTLQFSSLSPGVCSLSEAIAGNMDEALRLFALCVNMDLKDIKDETETGLHTACHGGAYQAVVEGFCGIRAEKDGLSIKPLLPAQWKSVEVPLTFCNMKIKICISHDGVKISLLNAGSIDVLYKGTIKRYDNADGMATTYELM